MTASVDRTESIFLQGAFAPVLGERTVQRLHVSGTLPAELDGLFTQIGPNPVQAPKKRGAADYSWFTQDGMVSGVRLCEGDALWFRNRWIRSRKVSRQLREPRVSGPRHFFDDTVHTNVVYHGNMLLGLVEAGCVPVRLNSDLETVEYTDFGGTLPRGFAAHPKIDPTTGEMVAVAYSPLRTKADYIVVGPQGRVRKLEQIALGGRPMMHDFAMTSNYVVLFDLPVRFDLRTAAIGRFPFRWSDRHRTRLGVLPRTGSGQDVRWFDIDACFVFHVVSAHDDGTRLSVRALRYPKAFEGSPDGPITDGAVLWEWVVDLATGRVREHQLDDRAQELPRSDLRRTGRTTRYHYALSGDIVRRVPDALLKHDHLAQRTELRQDGGVPSEPAFVPRGEDEDDGWLLHFRWDPDRDQTDLVVLDAQAFQDSPVAVVHLPFRVQFGFHSSWISATELDSVDAAVNNGSHR